MATRRRCAAVLEMRNFMAAALVFGGSMFGTEAVAAQVTPASDGGLRALAFAAPELTPSQPLVDLDNVRGQLAPQVLSAWDAFRASVPSVWKAVIDRRTGRVALAEGGNVALLPGAGNRLTLRDVAGLLRGRERVDLAAAEGAVRAFLPRVATLLGVEPAALVLRRERSGRASAHVWLVDFDVVLGGRPVEGARVVFRINNGNLVQWGSEYLPAPRARAPQPRLSRRAARAVVGRYIGGFLPTDKPFDPGSLHLLPVNRMGRDGAGRYEFGRGRDLAAVWQLEFGRAGQRGRWLARVEAESGTLLEFADTDRYQRVTGGVIPVAPASGPETELAMPFADVAPGVFANSAGVFAGSAGATSTLKGQYVWVRDACGGISQAADGVGDVAFGAGPGTDCATPGNGGPGNTHASRTQFYQVNRIQEVARGWLPTNGWLSSQLSDIVNLASTCNAYWNGVSINFQKSSSGCANSGELAGIALHEFGHGLDQNDGDGVAPEGGTGEAYADVTSALQLESSCVGTGLMTANCTGYGNACTACTGVRDVDYGKHAQSTPATVANFTQTNCPSFGFGAMGPCGKEAHCESYVPSEAIWDFANRDLTNPGSPDAWLVLDRLWYASRGTATSAFTCSTGLRYMSDGCSAGSWWKTMRAMDDDDGDLANGTPHSCNLYAAFDRHGIACTSDPGADTCFAGCAAPATPTLGLGAGANAVSVTLSGDGVFDVFRNDLGCDRGFARIASAVSAGSFVDDGVANGATYFYQAVAHQPENEACASPATSCVAIAPRAGCGQLPATASVTATATGPGTIALTWDAVAGATQYEILRATTSAGPFALVGTSQLPSFADTGLACNTPYYYTVRVEDASGCEAATSLTATAMTSACPTCTETALYSQSFDTLAPGSLAGWQIASFVSSGSAASWAGVQSCAAHSPNNIFRFGGSTCSGSYLSGTFSYAQPNGAAGIAVPAGATATTLSFWQRRQFEAGFDGATLLLSLDGQRYFFVPPAALSSGGYDDTLANGCAPSAAAGAPIFTGVSSTFTNTVVNLDTVCNYLTQGTAGCAGRVLRIGFATITDCSLNYSGWFLDDVAVTACVPPP